MECDGCTVCCKLLNVPWMYSPAGELCEYCTEGAGCQIFGSAPKKCLKYRCAYHQMENAGEALRPDKCGVIFEKLTDDIFIGLAVTDFKPSKLVRGQIDSLNREGFSVAFGKVNKVPALFLAEGKDKEEVFTILKEKYHDRPELHQRSN